jgi:acyl-CoA synthetase (AMP-forming)/AMP-acid ligase II
MSSTSERTGVTLSWPEPDMPQELYEQLCGPGAPFEIAVEDLLGVSMEVFANRPRTLVQLLLSAAERFGDRPYIVFPEREESFASIVGPVAAVARALQERYGIGKGDRVAIVAANTVEYVLAFWAVTALGGVTVAFNGWWTGPEMVYALELTRPKLLLGDRRRLERLEGLELPDPIGDVPIVTFEDGLAELEAAGAAAAESQSLPAVAIDEDDPFLILFTSGTTGRPKGVLLSHRSNIHFILASTLRGAEQSLRSEQLGLAPRPAPAHPRIIAGSPMFHIAGLNCQVVMATSSGMTIIYPPPGKWDERQHMELTARHGATMWSLVPTQLWRVLNSPDIEQYDLSSLAGVGGGSAVWPPEILRRTEELIPNARLGMSMGYGSTETTGLGATLGTAATYVHPETVGVASPTVQLQVRDDVTGEVLPEGEVGEICIRTASSFLGYWDNPEATAKALDEDRWYRTGDYGVIRDGYLSLAGRRQDLIIRGGENISPIEIENRIIEHPDVEEVAIVGTEHPTLGQEVAAFVVPAPGSALDEDAIRAWVADELAGFKVPTIVEFRTELPHNPSGKVLKHLLTNPTAASGFVEE